MNDAPKRKTSLSPAVKSLVETAKAAGLVTYRQKLHWLEETIRTRCRDPEILAALTVRLNWQRAFPPEVLSTMCQRATAQARAFDTGDDAYAQVRARWPIQQYCERFLGLRFTNHKAKCPMHDGDTQTSLVIDPRTNKFTCFGGCPPKPGQEHLTGDVVDLHAWRMQYDQRTALKDLFARQQLPQTPIPLPHPVASRPTPKSTTDSVLIAKALAAMAQVDCGYLAERSRPRKPAAQDFAELFLRLVGSGLPIVFEKLKVPIVGGRAKLLLRRNPAKLQYLCCSTAKTVAGGNKGTNLAKRLFLDVEWDHLPLADQLRLLWYLKAKKGWPLLAITFSGGKSYHGLYLVQGTSEGEILAMREQALALGACRGSLSSHQPVRFPGGYNSDKQARQTILYLNPEACTTSQQMINSSEKEAAAGPPEKLG